MHLLSIANDFEKLKQKYYQLIFRFMCVLNVGGAEIHNYAFLIDFYGVWLTRGLLFFHINEWKQAKNVKSKGNNYSSVQK